MEESTKSMHLGRKISRLRELRGIKQEVLADELGITQQAVSKLEASESVTDEMLEKIGKVLGVTPEGVKAFSEEAVFNYFNTFQEGSNGDFRHHCTFNPLDKVVELFERLVQSEKEKLQSEKEKVEMLERLLREK